MSSSTIKVPILRKLVLSKSIDLIGVAIVFGVCIFRNFLGTIYFKGEIIFDIPFLEVCSYVGQGAYPLGILATVGAVFSMLASRLIAKQNNTGNLIGIITTVNSGTNDFLFGNASAIITYPLSFGLNAFAFSKWRKGEKIRDKDAIYFIAFLVGLVIGFTLVYLGAYLFGGKTDNLFLITVAISFGLSIGATFATAFKYEETWFSWILYNIVQLVKNTLQLNIANVVKYIFYLIMATVTLFDWKLNGDKSATNKAV